MPEFPSFDRREESAGEHDESAAKQNGQALTRRNLLKLAAGAIAGISGIAAGTYYLQPEKSEQSMENPKISIGDIIDVRDEYWSKQKIDVKHEMLLRAAAAHGCFLTPEVLGKNLTMRSGCLVYRKLKNGNSVPIGQFEGHGLSDTDNSVNQLISILSGYGTAPEPPEPEDLHPIHEELKPHLDEVKYGYRRAGWEKDDVAESVGKAANFRADWNVRLTLYNPNPLKHPYGIDGITAIHPHDGKIHGNLIVDKYELDFTVDLGGTEITIGSSRHNGITKTMSRKNVPSEIPEYVQRLKEQRN